MATVKKKQLTAARKNQIRSPIIKRLASSPVTLQGWLHKQGSDGLMLWKKRWFVLADYCLFYYKGPAEEKLLGSLLLASYKISPCTSEDRIYRKFSFKAEHANMRTYYFSAESQTSMIQWINALSLASLLQENQSGSMEGNKIKSWLSAEHQPLYVNAPPKPRRTPESPDCSTYTVHNENLPTEMTHIKEYARNGQLETGHVVPPFTAVQHYNIDTYHPTNLMPQPTQNLTPELVLPMFGESYRVPLMNTQGAVFSGVPPHFIHKINSPNRSNVPPRPHSADFLEHEIKDDHSNFYVKEMSNNYNAAHLQRPKSSLDVIQSSESSYDSLHWSEESYAEKMRKTSLYVSKQHYITQDEKHNIPSYLVPRDKLQGADYHKKNPRSTACIDPYSNNKFIRSASARFPRQSGEATDYSYEENTLKNNKRRNSCETNDNKFDEREESMKRLMVWKQRMLQSPLTKKTSSSVHSMYQLDPALHLKMKMSRELNKLTANTTLFSENGDENSVPNSDREVPHSSSQMSDNIIQSSGETDRISKEMNPLSHHVPNIRTRNRQSYQFLSSDDDDISRMCEREERKYLRKSGSSKRNSLKYEDCEKLASSEIEPLKQNFNQNQSKFQFSVDPQIPADSRSIESAVSKCPSPIYIEKKPSKHHEADDDSSVASPILGQDFSLKTKKVLNDEMSSRNKTLDSGYSTLQNNIFSKDMNSKSSMNLSSQSAYESNAFSVNNESKLFLETEWGLKLDESRVIKEFSYHYINSSKDDLRKSAGDADEYFHKSDSKTFGSSLSVKHNNNEKNNQGERMSELNMVSFQTETDNIPQLFFDLPKSPDCLGTMSSKTNYSISDICEANASSTPDLYNSEKRHLVNTPQLSEPIDSVLSTGSQMNSLFAMKKQNLASSDEDRDEEVAAVLGSQENSLYSSEDLSNESLKSVLITKPLNIESPSYSSKKDINLSHSGLQADSKEEHYMPMTPKKKLVLSPVSDIISHSCFNSASRSLSGENIEDEVEESSYVEMSHNANSSQGGSRKLTPFLKGGSNQADSEEQEYGKCTHYEFVSMNSTMQEPVYVEVSVLLNNQKTDSENLGEDKNFNPEERNDNIYYSSLKQSLPDILNSSRSHNSLKSDSSDADDEASKDLESLSAPKHPRFSLSDTFRPASYYLGSNGCERSLIGISSEQQDSSDSDLVSPPPIPTSSPPVDDLDVSLGSSKTPKHTKKELKENSVQSSYWKSLSPGEKSCEKNPVLKKGSTYRDTYLYRRQLEEVSSETDSVDSTRKEQLLKRRPVSADLLDNLSESNFLSSSPSSERKSFGSDMDSVSFILNPDDKKQDFNQYLDDIQVNDQFIDSFLKTTASYSDHLLISKSACDSNYNDSGLKINNVIWEYERKKNDFSNKIVYDLLSEKNGRSVQAESPRDLATTAEDPCFNKAQSGAPYYYSDILKVGGKSKSSLHERAASAPESTLNLNNKSPCSSCNILNSNYATYKKQPLKKNGVAADGESKANVEECFTHQSASKPGPQVKQSKRVSTLLLNRSRTPDLNLKKKTPFVNFNSNGKTFNSSVETTFDSNLQRRSRSFDGLLEDNDFIQTSSRQLRVSPGNAISKLLQTTQSPVKNLTSKNEYLSSELYSNFHTEGTGCPDSQNECLKENHLRHARSLDDLDWCSDRQTTKTTFRNSVNQSSESSNEVFENRSEQCCNVSNFDINNSVKCYEHFETSKEVHSGNSSSILKFKGQQTGINNNESSFESPVPNPHLTAFEIDREKLRQWDSLSSAPSGMLSAVRCLSDKQLLHQQASPTPSSSPGCSGSGSGTAAALSPNRQMKPYNANENWNFELSAGELLGRTHEELVLLLIQLRRRSSGLCKAIDDCQMQINKKVKLIEQEPSKKLELSSKIDELKHQLNDLEKQYEKGKPLVNLVDNMVKLGSLYQGSLNPSSKSVPERLEFNQKVQEQRLLAEERKDWERLSPDHNQLQAKVEQLYKLDQLLQEESGTLQSLQQDKEMLEQALGGLNHKLVASHGNPVETEQCRRQKRTLEKELTRVHSVLAQNSKKLEETVAENARLEQELVVLRQKLQFSRRSAEPAGATAALESELRRVKDLVGDLQRQRQELCLQVRQLTEKSNSLCQQIHPNSLGNLKASYSLHKRKPAGSWMETDLDSQVTQEMGLENPAVPHISSPPVPVFSSSDANKNMCIIHKDKPQEIKTVRIVKRESERRQRDRDRNGTLGIPLINTISRRGTIVEETGISDENYLEPGSSNQQIDDANSSRLAWEYSNPANAVPPLPGPRSDSVNAVKKFVNKHKRMKDNVLVGKVVAPEGLTESNPSSEELSPVYLSKAAQEIVEEVAWRKKGERRLIPKEKRRHHTVSGQSLFQVLNHFSAVGSRDDLDMERALRTRIHTPDVVRSTLSRDIKFTVETIDNVLGTPEKIVIPERYVPESVPQFTKEEQIQRFKKAESIRKMLTQSTTISSTDSTEMDKEEKLNPVVKSKFAEEKRQRDHLLQLNQLLAQQVIEKSKIVAGAHSSVSQD